MVRDIRGKLIGHEATVFSRMRADDFRPVVEVHPFPHDRRRPAKLQLEVAQELEDVHRVHVLVVRQKVADRAQLVVASDST